MLQGIDVSQWQDEILWHDVAAAGIQFAGIKATEGVGFTDPKFRRNWFHSKDHGIRRIAYHFMNPAQSGEHQAQYFHGAVHAAGGFTDGDAAMLDIEQTRGQSPGFIVAQAEDWVQNILATTHVGVYIYTGAYFWHDSLNNAVSPILGKCPLWAASWGARPVSIPQWPSGFSIWQYSSSKPVPGIIGPVDGDYFNGDWKAYNLLAKYGGRR